MLKKYKKILFSKKIKKSLFFSRKTNQSGFPLLTVKILSWEDDKLRLLIEQQKFGEKFEEQTIWKIPIAYKSSARYMSNELVLWSF